MSDEINNVSQTDFLKIFMQELTYQDPLKPVDNREFMAQMAQFSALQEAQSSSESLHFLSGMTMASQSVMLLGKSVSVQGSEHNGVVSKIEFPGNSVPILHVAMNGENTQVELKHITAVWN